MRRLSDTLAHLAALRTLTKPAAARSAAPGRLSALASFGSNPGRLDAWSYAPESLEPGGALVVVLHGCTQTAAGYDAGAGWSRLAETNGFALLYPEQQRANNANLCFNWFEAADIAREGGEAQSIREMVDRMVRTHGIDPARVYVTGLSAGGAMAAVMLAAYPEVFAGGAVIAGLPHGAALGVPQALERMRGQGLPDGPALSKLVQRSSSHAGPWPKMQIWHGTADAVVRPANGEAIVEQWRALHGVPAAPDRQEAIGPHLRRVWNDAAGEPVLEHYAIKGMGHGVPLATTGDEALGAAGPYMLAAGLSSTRRIAASWGLVAVQQERSAAAPARAAEPQTATEQETAPKQEAAPNHAAPTFPKYLGRGGGVGKVIENALRAAGLMR